MIRSFLRSIAINALGIYLAGKINSELISFTGNFQSLLFTGLVIVLLNLLVRPIINLLLLPVHLVTLGTFRWVTNLLVLYIVTKLVPVFQIGSYLSPRLDLGFIIVPQIYFSSLGSYFLASFLLSLIFHLLYWLFEV